MPISSPRVQGPLILASRCGGTIYLKPATQARTIADGILADASIRFTTDDNRKYRFIAELYFAKTGNSGSGNVPVARFIHTPSPIIFNEMWDGKADINANTGILSASWSTPAFKDLNTTAPGYYGTTTTLVSSDVYYNRCTGYIAVATGGVCELVWGNAGSTGNTVLYSGSRIIVKDLL